jgi:hypothetical protein
MRDTTPGGGSTLGSGDLLEIKVYEEQDLSGAYRISPEGTIDFPLCGKVDLNGKTQGQAADALTRCLADRYIKDPHEVVGVGDVLKVWVVDVDKNRRRVSLTAIAPGSERQHAPRERQREQRPPRQPRQQGGGRPPRAQQGAVAAEGAPGGSRPPQGQRPPRPQGGPPGGGSAAGGPPGGNPPGGGNPHGNPPGGGNPHGNPPGGGSAAGNGAAAGSAAKK